MVNRKMIGKFITFEGGEGAGKGTQIVLLIERLRKEGFLVDSGVEPGGTDIGLECRKLLKDVKYSPNPITELLLFETSRSEFVEKIVRPKLNRGIHFFSDRFYDSTTIYQGLVRGLGLKLVNDLNNIATNGLVPDLTIVLDVDSKEGVANAIEQSRFELEGGEFHKKVNAHYRNLPKLFPVRNIVVISRESIEKVQEKVYLEVLKVIKV